MHYPTTVSPDGTATTTDKKGNVICSYKLIGDVRLERDIDRGNVQYWAGCIFESPDGEFTDGKEFDTKEEAINYVAEELRRQGVEAPKIFVHSDDPERESSCRSGIRKVHGKH